MVNSKFNIVSPIVKLLSGDYCGPMNPMRPLHYAETHYKFQLPWAPLFQTMPDVFLDAPHMAKPEAPIPLFLVIRDAHLFPIQIKNIHLDIRVHSIPDSEGNFKTLQKLPVLNLNLNLHCNQPFHFEELQVELPQTPGLIRVNARIEAELRANSTRPKAISWMNHNLPGLSKKELVIHRLRDELPNFGNADADGKLWLAGETHCHSWHSVDPVEYGAPVAVMQKAARCLGLGWSGLTDHSYDFAYERLDYMQEADPTNRWDELLEEVELLSEQFPVMIPGEEISCGNISGQNVHMIALNPDRYTPGLGDGGRRWLNNKPDLTIPEAIENAGKAFFYAAHPKVPLGKLEAFIFRRGPWWEEDLHEKISGLQFWNGSIDAGYDAGREFWIQQLQKGRRIFPIAGNDAHGDFNNTTGIKTPLFKLKRSQNHVYGKVRTVVHARPDKDSIQAALQEGQFYLTDGPFANLTQNRESHSLQIEARSSEDFGAITHVFVYSSVCDPESPLKSEAVQRFLPESVHFVTEFELPKAKKSSLQYYRLEVHTSKGKRALTPALFLEN